jgi:hypothetical protein
MVKVTNDLYQLAPNAKGEAHTDKVPTSAELGLQLNDPTYYLRIAPPNGQAVPETKTRRLYIVNSGSCEPPASDALNAIV